jgi:hypothetical protein|tara:strand:- start:3492 stop:3995 length:504 start_codon:yes stop_codon:yes gene_type:complete
MFKTPLLTLILTLIVSTVHAEEVLIQGTVQSRCVITTDTPGVYGNPNAYTLTTTPADGGVPPIVRFDVTLADAYYAQITTPTSFSSSPSIGESLTWTGTTEVSTVSDSANMGTYETNKVTFGQTTQYDLTATGSTWFKSTSTVTMGGNKAFPGGSYSAVVDAVCIAQ